jgi:hypothetical protein
MEGGGRPAVLAEGEWFSGKRSGWQKSKNIVYLQCCARRPWSSAQAPCVTFILEVCEGVMTNLT